jgi:hypothetical protein
MAENAAHWRSDDGLWRQQCSGSQQVRKYSKFGGTQVRPEIWLKDHREKADRVTAFSEGSSGRKKADKPTI